MTRVAIVTGGNKGIGYATCRALSKKFDGDVYLTARYRYSRLTVKPVNQLGNCLTGQTFS